MNIGILGSGNVAQTLGAGFLRHGHRVRLGTSNPAKLAAFAQANPGVQIAGFAATAADAELVVLAVHGAAALDVLKTVGAAALAGKTVIDTTNPIADQAPTDGVLAYFTGPGESLLERLQAAYPGVRFVKAFNSVGTPQMIDPAFEGGPPTMFIAGNDEGAKAAVTTLLAQVGWEAADMGSAVAARAIEPLAMLWCIPGLRRNEWSHAFKLLRRP